MVVGDLFVAALVFFLPTYSGPTRGGRAVREWCRCTGLAMAKLALCIAGEVRTFEHVKNRMWESVRALRADPFFAIADASSGQFRPWPFRPVDVVLVNTSHVDNRRKSYMAHTLHHCGRIIVATEIRRDQTYKWIIRMRTDTYYLFDWQQVHRMPPQTFAVWSNYIGGCSTDAAHERHCINDEWNIVPRWALEPFFFRFYEEYDAAHPFAGSLSRCPECLLGLCLWKHGFERVAYSVQIPIIRSQRDVATYTHTPRKLISLHNIVSDWRVNRSDGPARARWLPSRTGSRVHLCRRFFG